MKESNDNHMAPMTSIKSGTGTEAAKDIYYYTNQIVNVIFLGESGEAGWILIDTGVPGGEEEIVAEAEKRFGKNTKPSAIFLTHGHFDHVGNIVELIKRWNVPVYAHPLEFP